MSEALRSALDYYKKQIALAEERIQLFETNIMAFKDIGPPVRDTTEEAIENEHRLIENYGHGVRIIEDLFARDRH